ncbi:MAG TPA: VWA domain-containing protein [Vicinamibacteria bacterium]|nr:VWA domain-containing protein [Vicinamibacteria bacterium]
MSRVRSPTVRTAMVVAGSLCLSAAAAQEPQTPPTVRPAPAEVVMVDAVVVDRDGHPVTDLREDDFVLRSDGRERPITQFERIVVQDVLGARAARPPVSTNTGQETTSRPEASVVLVFDEQNIHPETLRDARKAALGFLDSSIAGSGELVLVGTGSRAVLRAREQVGLEALRAQVAQMKALHVRSSDEQDVSEFEAMQIAVFNDQHTVDTVATRLYADARAEGRNPSTLQVSVYSDDARNRAQRVWLEARTRAQATLAVVEQLANLLAGRRGRKSVVLLTEGFVLDGRSPEWKRTLDTARRANVVVYAVDVRSLREPDRFGAATARTEGLWAPQTSERGNPTTLNHGEAPMADRDAAQGSDMLVAQTGGFTRRYTNDLAGALVRIAAESRNYYLLGFEPTAAADGSFHPISLEVRRPGLSVRARKGYLALPRSETPAAGPIPLRLTAYLLEPRGDAVHVQLVGEIDPAAVQFDETDAVRTATIDWLLDVPTPGKTGSEPRRLRLNLPKDAWEAVRATWVPVGAELDLPPGLHVARMFVRDGASGGRVGMLEHAFEVPSPHAPYVSAVLSDMARGGAASAPAFVARRAFPAGAHLLYQFEVRGMAAGAADKLLAAHELCTAEGAVLARGSESPLAAAADGSPSRLVRISLEKTPPGHYELRLHVRDQAGGSRLDWAEPFEVIAAPSM